MAKDLPQRVPPEGHGRVLLVLAEGAERDRAIEWLGEAGYDVVLAEDDEQALALLDKRLDIEVVVAESRFAGPLLVLINQVPVGLALILIGPGDVVAVTQGMAAGALAYLTQPLTQLDFLAQVLRGVRRSRMQVLATDRMLPQPVEVDFGGVVGATPRMREVMDVLRKAAPTDAPVVILGETGTGKELIARALHNSSPRRSGPFVALHLLATPEGLLESELFGHKKGAFTGALTDRTGKLELADGGTLFLDELGDIPLETQAKLLRVLETKSFEPVGANRTVRSDFRIVAATNQDIEGMIRDKKFREELWFRLKVVRVELPPLRERRADIPLLVERFLADAAERFKKPVSGVAPEAMTLLQRHPWQGGNIRELRGVIEQMVILADGEQLTPRDVPREIRGAAAEADESSESGFVLAGRTMEEIEREAIKETLKMTDGNRKAAAELLQIGERTLYRKIEKFNLNV